MVNLSQTSLKDFFNRFFEEKDIPFTQFKIKTGGLTHFIDTEQVIQQIKNANREEQNRIVEVLMKIDRKNGDILDFLEHLAKGYIKTNY
jgi:hypothetical protein